MRVFSNSDTYVSRHACDVGGVPLLDHHVAVVTSRGRMMSSR
jgi:hypothetical protein